MASIAVTGQEMDEGLEDMWTESTQGISSIDPGKSSKTMHPHALTYVRGFNRGQKMVLAVINDRMFFDTDTVDAQQSIIVISF